MITRLLILGSKILGIVIDETDPDAIYTSDCIWPIRTILGSKVVEVDFDFTEPLNWYSYIAGHVVQTPPTIDVIVPSPVSPRQIRQALTQIDLRDAVEAAIAVADQDTKDWYEHAESFDRYHPKVLELAGLLNVTSDQLDQLWILAASL